MPSPPQERIAIKVKFNQLFNQISSNMERSTPRDYRMSVTNFVTIAYILFKNYFSKLFFGKMNLKLTFKCHR